jgi:hypothetical protein
MGFVLTFIVYICRRLKNDMIMEVIKLKNGFEGKVIERYHQGHKDIRPPYTLDGGFSLKGINGSIGIVKVLPPAIDSVMYAGEVLFSEIAK